MNYQSKIGSDRKISLVRAIVSSHALDNVGDGAWRVRWVIFAAVSAAIVWFSDWQGTYNLDPHHWGLMLSNAKDLADGRLPYRDIFIQYGILTTVVHAVAFAFLGHDLRTLILATSLFYAIGLIGVYVIGLLTFGRRSLALYGYLTCAMAHGLCIYPWSNYVAFPFLSFGIAAFLWRDRGLVLSCAAGVLLALAILAREGLFPAVVGFAVFAAGLELLETRRRERLISLTLFWAGLIVPIASFMIYLLSAKLFLFWYGLAVTLPHLYYEFFAPKNLIAGPFSLISYLREGVRTFNPRSIFFGLIILSAAAVFLQCVVTRSIWGRKQALIVAAATLLLVSAALHLAEVFRLVTSVAVGAVLVYHFASKVKVESILFWCAIVTMTFAWHEPINGNNYYPSKEQLSSASDAPRPAIFSGQRWPREALAYYSDFEGRMTSLQAASCGIRYFHNDTKDAFLATLTPFAQYQLAPFGRSVFSELPLWEWGYRLRPDIEVAGKVAAARDIVLFLTVKASEIESFQPPAGYFVVSRQQMPKSHFFQEGDFLIVAAPEACRKAP